jgi:hypothetical protein
MLDLISNHPDIFAIVGVVLYAVENILPHTPLKANSTVQLAIDFVKYFLPKKAK